ncbi:SUZ RNA Hypothetical protein domain containing 1 [Nesidiocoris tenuis]|uniref:SUZ RNA-binding domain-containing n=1 Tax=Nesidiocoris tenuis TaxID=355587 RepID=A0ABN7AWB4_9HEMI|nr:SUZ RNA Hypothetical protein domain containing 1 [Nesidiocoris tenuis]
MSQDEEETWEQLADSGELDRRLEKMKVVSAARNGMSSNHSPPVMILSEELRSKFMPPEPSVKILQRPTQNQNGCRCPNGETKPKAPIKTLQQREMEYAEARLRILGEARSPEEAESPLADSLLDDRIPRIQGRTEIPKIENNSAGIIRMPKGPDGTSGFNMRR